MGGRGLGFDEEALPVARDCLHGGLDAIGDDDVAASPAEHFEEGGFTIELSEFRVNNLPAGKVDAAGYGAVVDADGLQMARAFPRMDERPRVPQTPVTRASGRRTRASPRPVKPETP